MAERGHVYSDTRIAGRAKVHMGDVINNLNVQFSQQGSWQPAGASISAYQSVLILNAYYKDFCLKLEPITSDDSAPEITRQLLRESVALGETLAQVLVALDSSHNATSDTPVRPGEIVVSLTDALLLMCEVQTSIAPLLDTKVLQGAARHVQMQERQSEIARLAKGLRKQTTAFAFQLTMLSCKSDKETLTTCDALDALLQERLIDSATLQNRLLPFQPAPGTDGYSSDDEGDAVTRALSDHIEQELYISRAYKGGDVQGVSAASIGGQPSLRTTSTTATFYSVLSAIRVPMAESELPVFLAGLEDEQSISDRAGVFTARDWTGEKFDHSLEAGKSVLRAESLEDAGTQLPLWGPSHNSDDDPNSPWARKVVLCLDGNGVLSYASLMILLQLSEKIERLEKEPFGLGCQNSLEFCWSDESVANVLKNKFNGVFRPCDYIDYFCGTSTGGIAAMMFGIQHGTAMQALDAFGTFSTMAFGNPRKGLLSGNSRRTPWGGTRTPRYRTLDSETALQSLFASSSFVEKRMSADEKPTLAHLEILRRRAEQFRFSDGHESGPRTVVVAAGGKDFDEPVLFRSYDGLRSTPALPNQPPVLTAPSNIPLWKVGRATSAAPSYFRPMKIGDEYFFDGIIAGFRNPTRLAYDEVVRMHPNCQPCMIISIGTGARAPDALKVDPARDMTKTVRELLLAAGDPQNTHASLKKHIEKINAGRTGSDRVEYYRFDIPGDSSDPNAPLIPLELGEWLGRDGSATRAKMRDAVNANAHRHDALLEDCARKLVDLRRQRQRTVRWEAFALDFKYCCPDFHKCAGRVFESRVHLRRHLHEEHAWFAQDLSLHTWPCPLELCDSEAKFTSPWDVTKHLREVHKLGGGVSMTVAEMEGVLDEGRQLHFERRHQAAAASRST